MRAIHRNTFIIILILLPTLNISFAQQTNPVTAEILSPKPESTVPSLNVKIEIRIRGLEEDVKLEITRLLLGRQNITSSASFRGNKINAVMPNLPPAQYKAALLMKIDGKWRRMTSWQFNTIKEVKKDRKPLILPFSGSISSRYSHENISSKIRDVFTFDGNVSGRAKKLRWAGRIRQSRLESENLQHQNQYYAMINYKPWTLKVGDTQPRFSQFTLSGVRSRGFDISTNRRFFNIGVAWGDLLRSIDSSTRTVFVINQDGEPLKSVKDDISDSPRTSIGPGT